MESPVGSRGGRYHNALAETIDELQNTDVVQNRDPRGTVDEVE